MDLDTVEEAYEIEQKVFDWMRIELGLDQYLLAEQMTQRGHAETFGVDGIELGEV